MKICTLMAPFLLSGCTVSLLFGDVTESAFVTPNSSGVIGRTSGPGTVAGSMTSTTTGNVLGYEAGPDGDDKFQAFAGIASGATVTPPPAAGTATYTGTYEVAAVDFILRTITGASGTSYVDEGSIALEADFGAGTLTGTGVSTSSNPDVSGNTLSVSGTFSGDVLTGTATYDGVAGPLSGLVGSDEVIGVFHGNSDRQVHAGGFIAD
ncbi:MAG: hypothetical protein AAF762_06740 [Pseudomonadota bacterium]